MDQAMEKKVDQPIEVKEETKSFTERELFEVYKILQAMIITLPTLNSHRYNDRTYHNPRVEKMIGMCGLAGRILGANINLVEDQTTKKIREALNAIEQETAQ